MFFICYIFKNKKKKQVEYFKDVVVSFRSQIKVNFIIKFFGVYRCLQMMGFDLNYMRKFDLKRQKIYSIEKVVVILEWF